jgi:hypothetical protein
MLTIQVVMPARIGSIRSPVQRRIPHAFASISGTGISVLAKDRILVIASSWSRRARNLEVMEHVAKDGHRYGAKDVQE